MERASAANKRGRTALAASKLVEAIDEFERAHQLDPANLEFALGVRVATSLTTRPRLSKSVGR